MKKILITGGTGQLGIELQCLAWPAGTSLLAPGRAELDIADAASVAAYFAVHRFDAVINAAAYTAVDKAETEAHAAFGINCMGALLLSEVTRKAGIPLVHVSTDYVFDGTKDGLYVESDAVGPLGVYGASKEAGEQAVRTIQPRSVIVRTAWLVSPNRSNFLKTMLRLGAERLVLRVVDDQRGCPTAAGDLAEVLRTIALRLVDDPTAPCGTYHFVNAGETTWHGLAAAIFARADAHGRKVPQVESIGTADYPTPAQRPRNSRLSTAKLTSDYGITPRPWSAAIDETVDWVLTQ